MLQAVVSRRSFAISACYAARGRIEETPVYGSNPYLSIKLKVPRIKPSVRKELNDLDKELAEVKMNMVKMQNLEINEMLNRELLIHCRSVEAVEEKECESKTPVPFEPIEDLKYFYFWTVEGHFFALLESANQIHDECTKYSLRDLDEFDGIQERIGYSMNNLQYSQTIIKAKWNHNDYNSTFFGSYFDNILVRITSIWISKSSGMIFFHFCPTFRISLVLQLSIESSNICSVLHSLTDSDQPTVPSFLSKHENTFLIKVPLSQTTNLKLYANVKSDDIGEGYHRDVWRKNPVTSVIVDTVHPEGS